MATERKAIALCRVSSLEQVSNASLGRQLEAVLKEAVALDVEIVENGIWSGHVSSKAGTNRKRKDLNEMVDRCKRDKDIKILLVDEVDRFMRSISELFYYETVFEDLGVKVHYVSQPELNSPDPMVKLMKALEAFKSEASNTERIHKSIVGQTAAIRAGKYPYRPKLGYMKGEISGVHHIHPEIGPVIQEILRGVAEYKYTPTDALRRLNDSEYMRGRASMKMDKFRPILLDPYYAGVVEMNKQVVARNEHGIHDRLITLRQHNEILNILSAKRKNQNGPGLNGNPKYPLSNLVSCQNCIGRSNSRFVGFDHGNGSKNGKVYEKYRCRSCGRYVTKATMHERVSEHIKQFTLSANNKKKLIQKLESVWKANESDNAREIVRIGLKLKALNEVKTGLVEALANPNNEFMRDDVTESIQSKKKEIAELTAKADALTVHTTEEKTAFLTYALEQVGDFDVTFFEMPHAKRLLCKELVFPDGFIIDAEDNVLTPQVSVFNRLDLTKKDAETSDEALMVRVRRL